MAHGCHGDNSAHALHNGVHMPTGTQATQMMRGHKEQGSTNWLNDLV